ncbi:MAG: AIM24 family protein [Prosthecobacter sp.]|nr:AIM24 family protein [Prosthecobacter sp.]
MQITQHQRFELNLSASERFFACRRYEPLGHAPEFALPMWHRSIIPRMINGAWTMNSYSRPVDGSSVDFRAAEGHSFVELQLNEDEALVFNYRKLLGFSGGIRLHTTVSLSLATMSMNRLLFNLASGPGRIVFEVTGVPELHLDAVKSKSFAPSRLIAWSADSEFEIEVRTGTLDYYMSSVYLKPVATKGLVIDADEQSKSAPNFMLEILRKVYSPF